MEHYTLFGGETPPFPPKKNKPASAVKPISACLYKTLTLMLYNLINHPKKILGFYLVLTYVCRLFRILLHTFFSYYWIPMYVGGSKYSECEYFDWACGGFFFLEICSSWMELVLHPFSGKTPPFPPRKKTAFFSWKSVAHGWSVTPFFGAKRPLSPLKKQTCLSSEAHIRLFVQNFNINVV